MSIILTAKKGGYHSNLCNPPSSGRYNKSPRGGSDNIPDLRDKKSSMQELRERSLKDWKVERSKKLQRKEITELDKFCDNCKEHLNENVKIVKYDGPYSDKYSSYCPVCCRADLTDEFRDLKKRQEFMKKLEKNVYNEIVPNTFTSIFNPRFDVMKILGGAKCKRCPCDDIRALQIDHINGDGAKDRKRFNGMEQQYMWNYYIFNPKEAKKKLQVLCANCHSIKEFENKILTKNSKKN